MSRPDEELPLSKQKPVEEDVRREVLLHLERRTEELIQQGWQPARARAEAQRAFGDVESVVDECREITVRTRRHRRMSDRFEAFGQDVMFALRLLRRAPAFAIVAVLTLALGVGANTAIFSVINGLLLRPLPYDHPDRIVEVVELHKSGWGQVSWTNFLDLKTQSKSFEAMAEYYTERATLLGADTPLRTPLAAVSADFFRVMHVQPVLGRLPGPDDHRFGALPVAVVSRRFWREHLGATQDLSKVLLRGDFALQVIGVMPEGFEYPDGTDVWHPIELRDLPTSRTSHGPQAVGRLRANVTSEAAQRELDGIFAHIGETAGGDYDATGSRVTPLQASLTGGVRTPLLMLFGAAALLLLTACTNLASTLLARGAARSQELAVRTAIGAGRGRLVRQIFTESVVIAGLGCIVGVGLAAALLKVLIALAPPELELLTGARLDLTVLGFTAAVSFGTALIFGLLPALRIASVDPAQMLRAGGRTGGSPASRAIWSTLVASQVALATVLLIGAGLLLRSFAEVMNVDLGFQAEHVLTAVIDLPQIEYPDVSKAVMFHDRALSALRAIPGVQAAGVGNAVPLGGIGPSGGIQVEGKPPISTVYPITGQAVYRLASTGYFEALGIKILRGRSFLESDDAAGQTVALVNQSFADKEWPGEDPIGKRFRVGGMDPVTSPWTTIVGVVHNTPLAGVTGRPPLPTYYFSYRQLAFRSRWLTAVVRTTGLPAAMIPQVRNALQQVDPSIAVEFRTMSDLVAGSVADRRFTMLLLAAFASVALLLAAVGIYGVVSYSVAQRTREIGIRIALGATPGRVGRMVQGRALGVVAVGIVAGVLGAVVLTRLMQSLLFNIAATDSVSFGGVALLLLVTAFVASWLPARRGTRIDPIVAIRAEVAGPAFQVSPGVLRCVQDDVAPTPHAPLSSP